MAPPMSRVQPPLQHQSSMDNMAPTSNDMALAALGSAATGSTASEKRSKALRGRSFLNHHQRLEIIKKKDQEPKWTQIQLARWATVHFHLPKEPSQATIAILLKKRDQIKAATVAPQTRTIRPPRHPELEAALLLWVRFLQSKGVPFTGENIRLKASFLAKQLHLDTNLNFSTGWMSGFVSRHDLVLARAHKKRPTESGDEPVRTVLKSYRPQDVFAMDESALIYNDLPYDRNHEDHANPNRDRFCIGLAVNMDSSEKLEPLVVTTCRRKLGVLSATYYNVDGTMTARIFEQWLYKLNQKMASAQRKIVLLVDAAPSHFPLQLTHIRLVLLSYKVAQRAHPLEAGITKNFKALYRKTHLSYAVDQSEEGRASVFDVSIPRALHWIVQAWHEVSPELIRNCWARTGLKPVAPPRDQLLTAAVEVAEIHPEVVQSLVVSLSQLQLLETVPMETLLSPQSEHDAHYVYDDDTVVRIVAAEALPVGGETADGEQGDDDVAMREDAASAEDKSVSSQTPTTPSTSISTVPTSISTADRMAPSTPWRATHTQPPADDFHVVYEREPTVDELLANYRGVISSLDVASDRSDDHVTTLRFLRRKQVELRLQQQNPHEYQQQRQLHRDPEDQGKQYPPPPPPQPQRPFVHQQRPPPASIRRARVSRIG